MSAKLIQRAALTLTLLVASTGLAQAQYYNPCACLQPVAQTCYQTVPVTEMRPTVRKVMKPVTEVKYVEQPVTEYHPVTEQRTAEIPTVSYQNVTECQTVQRTIPNWQTAYHPVPKMSPCQYDPSPTFAGWMNRNMYGLRAAVTPDYYVSRQYAPQTVAQTIPVTRQVAIRGTRQVTYNVTRMETKQTTRRVAVNTTRYVEAEETVMTPVTVYRTVPTGTSVVYAPWGTTQTVLAPSADPISRSATNSDKFERTTDKSKDATNLKNLDEGPVKRSSFEADGLKNSDPFPPDAKVKSSSDVHVGSNDRAASDAVRVSRWRPTGAAELNGPQLIAPSIASR